MYSLFIDTLSSPAYICLFDTNKAIKDSISWEGKHTEFDTLIESIHALLKSNALEYLDITGIVCIVGPGGFTGIRITTLVANTLGYTFGIPLYPITVSEFFYNQESTLPWVLPLTKTEVLFWENGIKSQQSIVKINTLENVDMYTSNQIMPPLGNHSSYFQANNYAYFLKHFSFPEKASLLRPIYARDPNVFIGK